MDPDMKAADLKKVLYNKFLRAYRSEDHQFDIIHAEEMADDMIVLIYPTPKEDGRCFSPVQVVT